MEIHRLMVATALLVTIQVAGGDAKATNNETVPLESVEAVAEMLSLKETVPFKTATIEKTKPVTRIVEAAPPVPEAAKPPTRVEHIVIKGDTLDAIAQKHQTTWPRLFDANLQIANANVIAIGDKVSVPRPDEQIAPRTAPPAPQPVPAPTPPVVSVATTVQPVTPDTSGGLVGSIGYALWSGNCVNEPGVNNPGGDVMSWPATSGSPWIGATALFQYQHVGVVTGIWPNGDVEVRHQNFKGNQTRFSRSTFRGFR